MNNEKRTLAQQVKDYDALCLIEKQVVEKIAHQISSPLVVTRHERNQVRTVIALLRDEKKLLKQWVEAIEKNDGK